MKWKGVWTALVTPFRGEEVDIAALKRLVEIQLKGGVHGLCPCGTTGEGSSLSDEEFSLVLKTVLKSVGGRIPVVPGTGSNNTEKTIERTRLAHEMGASGALVVTPYYVKPNQDGLRRHYERISESVDLPLLLYNVPGRTAVNMLPETVEKIAKNAQVGGVKECAPLPQVAELIHRVGNKVSILSGEDGVFFPFLSLGGDGVVSVAANVAAPTWVEIYSNFEKGDLDHSRKRFFEFSPLTDVLFVESNPIPVKTALAMMGLISDELRCPLAPLSETNQEKLESVLSSLELSSS